MPAPSPTYSHLSPLESPAQVPTYHLPQNLVLPPGAGYQVSYPRHIAAPPHPHQRVQMTPTHAGGVTYYSPVGEQHMYQTPTHPHRSTPVQYTPSPYQTTYVVPPGAYEGHHHQMMVPSPMGRSYDTTIPQYYPITTGTDQRWVAQMAPNGMESATKRKREKKDKSTPSASAMKKSKAPKQQRSRETTGDSSSAKRVKRESRSSRSDSQQPYQYQPTQLPTPPLSTRESDRTTLPVQPVPYDGTGLKTQVDPAESSYTRRRGVMITRHQDEGRKLGIVGTTQAGEEEVTPGPEEPARSPRTMTIPALTTDSSGLAVLSTDQVLESEVAWLEYSRGPSPPSSPDMIQLQTPHLSGLEGTSMLVEEQETPMTRAEKMAKRLTLFDDDSDRSQEDRMVSTRIDVFGRVAVRKDVAMKFLGLDHAHGGRLVEETRSDDGERSPGWRSGTASTGSSSKLVRPSWPDDEAPWALAGGSKKARIQKQEEDKAATIRRYLDNASDESSDDDDEDLYIARRASVSSRAKGKGAMRSAEGSLTGAQDDRRKIWPNPQADARTALLFSIRNRELPPVRVGKVACACGATQSMGMGPMIECCGCRTYHHLACCGIDEDALINPQWWCPRCSTAAIAPIQSGSQFDTAGLYSIRRTQQCL